MSVQNAADSEAVHPDIALIRAPQPNERAVTVNRLMASTGIKRRYVDAFASSRSEMKPEEACVPVKVCVSVPRYNEVVTVKTFACPALIVGSDRVIDRTIGHLIPTDGDAATWLLGRLDNLHETVAAEPIGEHATLQLAWIGTTDKYTIAFDSTGDAKTFKYILSTVRRIYNANIMCRLHGRGDALSIVLVIAADVSETGRAAVLRDVAVAMYEARVMYHTPRAWEKHQCVTLGGAPMGLRGHDGTPFRMTPDQCTAVRLLEQAMLGLSPDIEAPETLQVGAYSVRLGWTKKEHVPVIVNRAAVGTGKTSVVSAVVASMAESWTRRWIDFMSSGGGADRIKSKSYVSLRNRFAIIPTVLIYVGDQHKGLLYDMLHKVSGQSACNGALLATHHDIDKISDFEVFFKTYHFVVISQVAMRRLVKKGLFDIQENVFPLLVIEESVRFSGADILPPSSCVLINDASIAGERGWMAAAKNVVYRGARESDERTDAYFKYWAIHHMRPIVERRDVRHEVIVVEATNAERRGLSSIGSPLVLEGADGSEAVADAGGGVKCVTEADLLHAYEAPARARIDRIGAALTRHHLRLSLEEASVQNLLEMQGNEHVKTQIEVRVRLVEDIRASIESESKALESANAQYHRHKTVVDSLIAQTPIECPVCLAPKPDTVVQKCLHTMCLECYGTYCTDRGVSTDAAVTCPMCRTVSVGWYVTVGETLSGMRSQYGSKADVLRSVCAARLAAVPNSKIIVVCQERVALSRLMHLLSDSLGIACFGTSMIYKTKSLKAVSKEVAGFREHAGPCVLFFDDTSCSAGMDFNSAFMIFVGVVHTSNAVDHLLFEQFMGRVVRGSVHTAEFVHILFNRSLELKAFCQTLRPALLQSGHTTAVRAFDPEHPPQFPDGTLVSA